MGVASCRSTYLCLMLRVHLVPFRISIRDLIPFSGRARRGFRSEKWLGPTQPNPTQPSPARPCAPLAPTPPMRPLLLSLSFGFPAQQLPSPSSTSLSPWCPRDWRRRSPEFGPRGELPSPPLLSFSPSPSSSFPPARALSFPCSRAPLPSPLAGGAAPPPPCPRRHEAAPALPSPRRHAAPAPCSRGGAPAPPPARLARPPVRPRRGLGPLRASSWPVAWFAWPWHGLALPRLPLACSRVRKPALAVIIFGW
jgi:hypothetical protein